MTPVQELRRVNERAERHRSDNDEAAVREVWGLLIGRTQALLLALAVAPWWARWLLARRLTQAARQAATTLEEALRYQARSPRRLDPRGRW